MDAEALALLKTAVLQSLPEMQRLASKYRESELVWRRGETGWRGEWQERPSLATAFSEGRTVLEQNSADFARVFSQRHPDHAGLVGFPNLGSLNMLNNSAYIVSSALGEL